MKKNILSYLFTYIVSYILGCIILLSKAINFNPYVIPAKFINSFHFSSSFFIKAFYLSIPIFLAFYLLFYLLKHWHFKPSKSLISSKKILITSFISNIITGLLFILTYYPGSAMTDTFDILTSPIGVAHKNPLLYNLIVTIPFRLLNRMLHNMNLSFFIISIIQLIVISGLLSIIVTWFHKTFKHNKATIFLILYFTLLPIVANYNTAIGKDAIYNLILLSLIPILYNIIQSKGAWLNIRKNFILMIFIFTITTLMRNNGLYIIIFTLLVLILTYKKLYKKGLLTLLIVVIINSLVGLFPGVKEPLFQEKVGIPLQQIAYVNYVSGNIDPKDLAYLNNILPLTELKNKYHPYYVDNIKWDPHFDGQYLNKTKEQFLKTWFNILPNNFESYVKSYLLVTYATYTPYSFVDDQSRFLGINKIDFNSFPDFKEMHAAPIFPTFIQKNLTSFYDQTVIYLNNGSCFLLLITLILYIIYRKKANYLLITAPYLAIWLILMLATPLATALRYMSSYIYALPFLYLIILLIDQKKEP